jgi:Superfamily II DNA/RNA helicases, SNF2 family
MLTGDIDAEERFENIRKFQAGEVRAIIAHPKAGGVGVNLTAASYSIHYSRSYSLTDDLQSEARNYRGGSERHKRITRIDIIAEDTIDEDISAALKSKKQYRISYWV